ncbi:copia protein [Tanacetum coccineum]|uniref:Copia protein n=1 Tax=Tanacetum coccineum TaxID=301880 RepID=A0ABQ4WLG6_9ASTR
MSLLQSSFMNIDNDGECASNTPIGAKIYKIERQIGEGKLRLLDNDGNPLVPTGIVESDSEVELVFDENASLRIPTSGKDENDKGYATYLASAPLLEQWDMCNAVVLNWILSSLSQDVYLGHVFSDNAGKVFGKNYKRHMIELMGHLEFDILTKLPNCTCDARTKLVDHVNYHLGWIIDSGANQHMTNSTKDMIDLVDVSDLKLTVGHLNETPTKITHVGNLKLNNDVILFNVLVVTEYTDLREGRVLGTGSEINGLYLFNMEYNKSATLVSPSVVDDTVEKEKLSPVVTTTEPYLPLPTQVTTSAGNALDKSSYANVTGMVRSMFNSSTGLFSFKFSFMDGLDAMLENGPWLIRDNPLIMRKWHPNENLLKEDVSTIPYWFKLYGVLVTAFREDGLSAIATKLAIIEIRADLELKDNIVAAMPKITKEGYYTCNIRVEYEWKPPRCACCKGFQLVSKNSTANTFGKKKNNSESTKDVSKSNPFEVLATVDNDVELGKLRFVDDDENTLVPTDIVDSDSEVEVVFDKNANLRLSKNGKDGSDKGYGTNSLLEQWRDSYLDNDDYDPYDDDIYKNHDISEHL